MNRILMFLAFTCCFVIFAEDSPVAKLDLRKFGYQFTDSTSTFADCTDLGFLSEDLLLISINQRSFGRIERMFADAPDSTLVVFDIGRGGVLTTGKMSVEKTGGSVQPVAGKRFAVLNEKGLRFCDVSLQCGAPVEARGPLFVSPQGRQIAFGGNGPTAQRIIDTESLKQVAIFEPSKTFQQAMVIPGDGPMLVDWNDRITVRRQSVENVPLNIDDKGTFREFRFLNSGSLAGLDHDASEVVVMGVDGKQIRRYKVAKAWRTGFLPTASGARFGIHEHGYTALNSIINFLDTDDGRPQDFQRVRVIDLLSGNEVSRLEWDPRPHLIKPALSPSGHRLARVRSGILEIFQIK